ncbi:EF-hand domain-containing protein [Roseovarius sp. 2305UL8-3]|uniref:EF-hand domain-containing protein n=1 Tax=Roseovarius conchicola TaxID=3121636 RepID=UPI0035293775
MTKELIAASFAFALSLPVAALAGDAASMDADGDGAVTMTEFQAAYPDAEAGTFSQADANADGMLTSDEISEAQAQGVLPATDG